ncbi:N-acetyltransferase family protein [Alteribacillus sp. JSM 102045]|uniref:GNAT family N-acetyltransferase n=1 Tax=Alteribacillus sp. JSM 102045 TaxID=1562101 RepID=UPI0035C1EF9E
MNELFIRSIRIEDCNEFQSLLKQVDGETDFMLYGAGERVTNRRTTEKLISSFLEAVNSNILIAEMEHNLVGYGMVIGGKVNKNKHCASIVLGILRDYSGKGIGTTLLRSMEKWAVETGVKRIELTTITHNEAAVSLYKNHGFEIEGLKKRSLLIKGSFIDEYYMAKLL